MLVLLIRSKVIWKLLLLIILHLLLVMCLFPIIIFLLNLGLVLILLILIILILVLDLNPLLFINFVILHLRSLSNVLLFRNILILLFVNWFFSYRRLLGVGVFNLVHLLSFIIIIELYYKINKAKISYKLAHFILVKTIREDRTTKTWD